MEFVNFLKNPQQYSDLGAKIPKVTCLLTSQFILNVGSYPGHDTCAIEQGTFKNNFVKTIVVYLVCSNTMCVSTCQVEFVLGELSCFILLPRSRQSGVL